jgi:7,8-dihydropterin-6-yl-methyl-4-(beta-D-ribofuranosyl)aminobenzene 5'-phosphate synthase
MKVSIVYDNTLWDENLVCDWGFSCLIEANGRKILFDTGAKGDILLGNMKRMGIDPSDIDGVFISHDHWDHTGGLPDLLKEHRTRVYVPGPSRISGDAVTGITDEREIFDNIFSTGTLKNIEQSIIIREENHLSVIAGCSHPGVKHILDRAGRFGSVGTLIGGLHGFHDFEAITGVQNVCPVHCTKHISEIHRLFPDKFIQGGAGRVITI